MKFFTKLAESEKAPAVKDAPADIRKTLVDPKEWNSMDKTIEGSKAIYNKIKGPVGNVLSTYGDGFKELGHGLQKAVKNTAQPLFDSWKASRAGKPKFTTGNEAAYKEHAPHEDSAPESPELPAE